MKLKDTFTIEREYRYSPDSFSGIFPALERAFRGTVLLETPVPGGNSILVWDPVASITVHSDAVDARNLTDAPLPSLPVKSTQVPQFMQEVVDRYRLERTGDSHISLPFTGGFAGFVGYEWSAGQESASNQSEPGVPDMWFGLYDRALVADASGDVFLVAVQSIRNASIEEVRKQLYGCISHNGTPRPKTAVREGTVISYDFPKQEFENGVRDIRSLIRSGDVYQVNIAQRIRSSRIDPWHLYTRLKSVNPSPYCGILSTGDFTIVSNSPERLLKVSQDSTGTKWVSTRPIAGTRPRGSGRQDTRNERALRVSPKERAEHTMLVDLSRNDLGRISQSGSVEVDELLTVERYSHVMHLVSNVKGRISPSAKIPDIFRALMPGGSVTGTPKISANEVISTTEPVPRGAYTGSLGYVSLNGDMDFNILIRSSFYPENSNVMHVYAGSGIVQDSVPSREWSESKAKAQAMLETIQDASSTGHSWIPPTVLHSWKPPLFNNAFPDARVLLIDNYDSFTYNLVQYLSALGASVTVVRNDSATMEELKSYDPTHLVISPGPGRPEKSGISVPAILAFQGTPTLGVCLGHQAIIEAYGGSLVQAHIPMHGKVSKVSHNEDAVKNDILSGIPSTFLAGRYHSLVAGDVPEPLVVTAKTSHEEVMAVQHRSLPTFGVQFHPESILTPQGIRVFSNFLAVEHTGEVEK